MMMMIMSIIMTITMLNIVTIMMMVMIKSLRCYPFFGTRRYHTLLSARFRVSIMMRIIRIFMTLILRNENFNDDDDDDGDDDDDY